MIFPDSYTSHHLPGGVCVTRSENGAAGYFWANSFFLNSYIALHPPGGAGVTEKTAEKLVFKRALTGVISLLPTKVKLRIPYEPKAVASPEGRKTPRKAEIIIKTS